MFFIMGISNGRKQLDFNQSVVCQACGKYGRYEVFMEYMFFSLFFIPIIKWNKSYYVRTSCCGSIYSIDKELGSRIARGESVTINEQDLHMVHSSHSGFTKHCPNCGFETHEDYQYCPKCSSRLQS